MTLDERVQYIAYYSATKAMYRCHENCPKHVWCFEEASLSLCGLYRAIRMSFRRRRKTEPSRLKSVAVQTRDGLRN